MKQPITAQPAEGIPAKPFVNEECGDTMWDAVLLDAEERLQQAAGFTPVNKMEKQAAAGFE